MNRRADRNRAVALIVAGAVLALSGCGGGGGGGGAGPTDPVAAGWTAFTAGDYVTARTSFMTALAASPTNADALDGLGWTLSRMDSVNAALIQFAGCLAVQSNNADALAGRAGAALAAARNTPDPDLDLAITSADAALALEPNFQFNHDSRVNWKDLHLVLAQASFAEHDYARAASEVTSLGGAPPTPGADDYVQQLLAEIQRLKSVIG